uniref:Uncharacterized protein n=1 Tax=Lotharella globosa TaxID=91324 RepID=A0A7S3Z9L0_9EUKA
MHESPFENELGAADRAQRRSYVSPVVQRQKDAAKIEKRANIQGEWQKRIRVTRAGDKRRGRSHRTQGTKVEGLPATQNVGGSNSAEGDVETGPWVDFKKKRRLREERAFTAVAPIRLNRIVKRRRILQLREGDDDERVTVITMPLVVRPDGKEKKCDVVSIPSMSTKTTTSSQPQDTNSSNGDDTSSSPATILSIGENASRFLTVHSNVLPSL